MTRKIRERKLDEGELLNRWMYSRLIAKNKNVIIVTTGPTGSGKSYVNLRIAELWYKRQFKDTFPDENICTSINEVIKLVHEGKLRRGEIIILEEAGANYGALDFQNKVSKLFSYLLQTFRSMNIALIMNLPVMSMLNKQARQLVHMHIVMSNIDFGTKTSTVRPLLHQLNQMTGKSYWKYPRAKVHGRGTKVERLNFGLPSEDLIKRYENKKRLFLTDMTAGFMLELESQEQKRLYKTMRKPLSPHQIIIFDALKEGKTVAKIAKEHGWTERAVYYGIEAMKKKGYEVKVTKYTKATQGTEVQNPYRVANNSIIPSVPVPIQVSQVEPSPQAIALYNRVRKIAP